MSVHIVLRLLILFMFAFLCWPLGQVLAEWMPGADALDQSYYPFILALAGALVGYLVAPYLTVVPYTALRQRLSRVPARSLFMGVVGCVVGLIIAALLAVPLAMLPGYWGQILPVIVALTLAALGGMTLIMRDRDILSMLGLVLGRDRLRRRRHVVLMDTSVIIDGRIADILQTGFISGTMIVPRFVLDELQHIADSADVLRRNRGRRGLDILNKMQKDEDVPLEVSDMDAPEIREVDGKLIKLAQELDCAVLTNDYNLNRVAELQGVQILNINELANAVKAIVLPGETLRINIIQEGKEHGQGVGYLDDGTMVVVEEGRRHMNSTVEIVVTRVLQTVAGRMIFGQIQNGKH
jgi:uncharacterized protein YacL